MQPATGSAVQQRPGKDRLPAFEAQRWESVSLLFKLSLKNQMFLVISYNEDEKAGSIQSGCSSNRDKAPDRFFCRCVLILISSNLVPISMLSRSKIDKGNIRAIDICLICCPK